MAFCFEYALKILWDLRNALSKNYFKAINQIVKAYDDWGRQFTYDCEKVSRGKQTKWFDRQIEKVKRVADRSRLRFEC